MNLKGFLIPILITIFLLGVLVVYLYSFLAKTEQVDADLMILEGWVKEETLDAAAFEFKVSNDKLFIITGGPLPSQDVVMPYSSELRVRLEKEKKNKTLDSLSKSLIEVEAFGTILDGVSAHFKVRVNDSVIGDAFTTNTPDKYTFTTNIAEKKIDSLSVIFDNDEANAKGDRNFIFKNIKLNGRVISPFSENVFVIRRKDKKLIKERVYRYFPERTAVMLEKRGIDKTKIIPVPSPFVERDRTYESALSVKNYLEEHHPGIESFNVVTEGVHARRSWMMYKKAFGKDFNIGIIALENGSIDSSNWWRSKEGIHSVMEQLGKYLYARFWFVPFG